MGRAEYELGFRDRFDYVVTNDELPRAIAQVEKIIGDFLAR